MKLLIVLIGVLFVGCTDADWDVEVKSIGRSAHITCYSGGKIIFESQSTGQVTVLSGGGWGFRSTDGKIVKTFADCFVIY